MYFGSPCPCFEKKAGSHVHSGGRQSMPIFWKKAVFIYTGGRQPCPFWRQAVHVHVLKKRQSLYITLEAGSHVHSGGWQSMSSGFGQSMSMFWKKAVFIYTGGRQSMSMFWKNGSLYLYWRQAPMFILEAGSPCPFWRQTVFIYTGGRQPCPFWRQAVHVHVLKRRQSLSILEAGSHVHSGGRQSMYSISAVHVIRNLAVHVYILKNGQSLFILEVGSHVHSAGW